MHRGSDTGDLLTPTLLGRDLPALDGGQWETLFSQARRARLAGRLAHHAAVQGWLPQVAERPRAYLEGMRRLMVTRQGQLRWELQALRRALAGHDLPMVLLKGAAYAAADLPPWRGRHFSDIDVLVPAPRVRDVESLLLAAGWVAQQLDDYDDRYYRQWMHELPPLVHVERGTVIDVHHTIAPPTSRWPIDGQALLQRARPLADAVPFHVLAPEDMVLHSLLHLLQDGDMSAGLRDLLDVHDLLGLFNADALFWSTLADRAVELRLVTPLIHGLDQLQRLGLTAPPPSLWDSLASSAPSRLQRSLMQAALRRALRPDHPSCDVAGTALARQALYIRSHWLRMPWYQILPHLVRKAWRRASDGDTAPRAETNERNERRVV